MELTVVTSPEYFSGEGELINKLFASGLQSLHIRKPVGDLPKFSKLMESIDPVNYPLTVIHQHHEVAPVYGIRRLHYTEQHRKETSSAARKELLLEGYQLSSSVHEVGGIDQLEDFAYVFFGPVFNSISKTGYSSVIKAGFVLPPHATKIFAIGGVTAGNLKKLLEMGFDGAAILGAIWLSADPLAAVLQLMHSINETKKWT
jgi:thiamine-phosphate pyrophosphorylase